MAKYPAGNCLLCGEPYEAGRRQFYCSKECSDRAMHDRRSAEAKSKRINITCEWCGNAFDVIPSHSDRKFCGQRCYGDYRKSLTGESNPLFKPRVTALCDYCDAPFEVGSSKIYCSKKCSDQALHDRRSAEAKANRVIVTCQWCGKQWDEPPNQAKRKFCGFECYGKYRQSLTGEDHPLYKPRITLICDLCGESFEVPQYRDVARFCSNACKGAWTQANAPKVSAIEAIVATELNRRQLLFDAQTRIGPYLPDFLIGDTVVEVDGDYWHNLPDVAARDIRKNEFYEANGFSVVRIWEHEIHAEDFSKLDALEDCFA